MSGLSILLGVGWPGGGLVGPPSDWVSITSLIVAVVFTFGVCELAHSVARRRHGHPLQKP